MTTSATSCSTELRIRNAQLPGHPVVTRRSLRSAGVHRNTVARRIADGRLNEIWPDTFLVGIDPHTAPGEVIHAAAVAAAGPGSAIDATTALHRRGLWPRHDGMIHVASNRRCPPVPCYRVCFHRRMRIDADDVHGIPTRTALDALFAAAPLLTPLELTHVISRGEYSGDFELATLERALADRTPSRWVTRVRTAVELRRGGSNGTRSKSEDKLYPPVARMFGEPLVNVFGAAGIPDYEPDLCWPDRRWIVEVDGSHHLDEHQRRKDQERDRALRAAGWVVVRIWWEDIWNDIWEVLDRIGRAFGMPSVASAPIA